MEPLKDTIWPTLTINGAPQHWKQHDEKTQSPSQRYYRLSVNLLALRSVKNCMPSTLLRVRVSSGVDHIISSSGMFTVSRRKRKAEKKRILVECIRAYAFECAHVCVRERVRVEVCQRSVEVKVLKMKPL